MTLSLDPVVSVNISVTPAGAQVPGFGNGLLVGTSAVLPLYDRVREYASAAEVAVDFGTSVGEYLGAVAAFSQEPAPETIKIGRLFTAAQAAYLRGGVASSTLADYTGVTDGGFDIMINGSNRTIADLNFSGAANMAAVATLISTALNAALAGTTCTWIAAESRFLITSPSTGTGQTIGYAVAPTTGGPSADISALLKFTGATGAIAVQGIAAETIATGLAALKLWDPDFYGLALTSFATVQNIKDAALWNQTNKGLFFYVSQDPLDKLSATTTDLFSHMQDQGYTRAIGQFSTTNPYAHVSLMARTMVVDFDQPNSTITLKFKKEPGVAAEPLTTTEAGVLKDKNANYYVDRQGFVMIEEGVTATGRFIDEVHGLDWLEATLQVAAFNALATSTTKIPLTDAGAAKIVLRIKKDGFDKAVRNGLLAPGVWNGENLGEVASGDLLPEGYYVYASPVAEQSSTDRDLRKAPPISAICIGAGAIHSATIAVTFQR